MTAELFRFRDQAHNTKCVSKVRFVFEIKNNAAPVVLLTQFGHSPNLEDWLGLKRRETVPKGLESVYYTGYWNKLIQTKIGSIFTQYCSFQRKKANEELMALHPDNLYEGLSKITQFCEEAIERDERSVEPENGYWRDFLYLPVLFLADDLYELHSTGLNKHKLKKVQTSILVYNYHFKNVVSMAYVFVVTKKGFKKFIKDMLKIEEEVETEMIDLRNKNNP